MIQARVTIFVHPSRREEMVHGLRSLIEPVRLDSACLACRLYTDVADPNAITILEEWATRPALERRLRSAAYGQLLQLMELSHEPPETVFHVIAETQGLEAIRKIRLPDHATATDREGQGISPHRQP